MRSIAISIILLGYIVTVSKCEQAYETNAVDFDALATDVDKDSFLKRMERRAYTYMTGVPGSKRLPNYNFGLGKRARYIERYMLLCVLLLMSLWFLCNFSEIGIVCKLPLNYFQLYSENN